MAGWNLKNGSITKYPVRDEQIWSLFNYVFSESCMKRNTYKFGLIKALLDSTFSGKDTPNGVFFTYEELFSRFAENYWNLVVKFNFRQMRKDGRSTFSRIEKIFFSAVENNPVISSLEFNKISERQKIVKQVVKECKGNVVGALYNDFDGIIYEFDLDKDGLTLNRSVHRFMMKHKHELERLNYYAWAKFLESINDDVNVLAGIIEKLELASPERTDLSLYRELLSHEKYGKNCFYCGQKLSGEIHVDHFIPWSFIENDKIWNLVLSCPTCNESKKDKLPTKKYLLKLVERNKSFSVIQDKKVQSELTDYNDQLVGQIWEYAKSSGLKPFLNIPKG